MTPWLNLRSPRPASAVFALCLALVASGALAEDDLLPPDQAFRFSARLVDVAHLEVRYRIAAGYYMYRDKFRFSAQPSTVALGKPEFPAGKIKEDEFFGKVETYRDELVIRMPFKADDGTFALQAQSQGCADVGVCYTPIKQTAQLVLAAASIEPAASSSDAGGALSKLRTLTGGSSGEQDFLPMEKAFKVDVKVRDANTLVAEFAPADTYYLYRDKIRFEVPKEPNIAIAKVSLPRGEMKSDPNFGDTEVFHKPFQAVITLDRAKARDISHLAVEARYQGCSEKGLCYPPAKKSFDLTLAAWQSTPSPATATPAIPAARLAPPSAALPAPKPSAASGPAGIFEKGAAPQNESASGNQTSTTAGILKSGNFWAVVASFFGAGLLLSFTPCVLPMVPILSGIIVGQGHQVTRGQAFSLSVAYVLGMAITYALAGIGAGLSGTLLSNALQNPWVLGAFAALFVALSLSMFGFYELQLPSALQSKLSDTSNKVKGGTLGGVFIMGVLSALIVGPCVAAPLAGALLYINQTRNAALGGSALFALALGMGVPLLAVGLSAGALLPKAGAWMQTVKNLFGVMLLGLAIWIISPVVPSAAHMLLWAALLIVSAIYLHAVDPLPHNSSGFRKLWKGMGVIALLVGVALLVGALSGGRDILQPLAGLRGAGAATTAASTQPKFERVRSVAELDQRIAQAGGRAVMLDFYADWCVSCKEMERFTFGDPQVQARMGRMLLLQADVTANTEEDAQLLKRFGLFGPPGILFFAPGGRELEGVRVIGFQPAEMFRATLDAALQSS
jgi:thiol:disulfide interchange protein DsbD